MKIYRNGKEIVLTDEEIMEAHAEHIKSFMRNELITVYGYQMKKQKTTLNWRIRIIQVEMAIPNTIALNGRLPFMIYRI